MTRRDPGPGLADGPPRVGLFGLLGSGNLGNDGSLEAILTFLRDHHPHAELSCMCAGPERVSRLYGIPAVPLHWYRFEYERAAGPVRIAGKVAGKIADAGRILTWVRRQDAVIVPGMGVLEATLPLRPWGLPYSLLLLCASGRLTGTRVALVGVGASPVRRRSLRWLLTAAARLAHYRSYRDQLSADAMRRMGVDVGAPDVYPDLAFALPVPPEPRTTDGSVGVGVMAYGGGDDDRERAAAIREAYVRAIQRFVRWLIGRGRPVRLFIGDAADTEVTREIIADLRADPNGLDPSYLTVSSASSLSELMHEMTAVDTVVATRYHNVLCALKLAKPTLSVGYAAKNDALMEAMGLGEFCQSADSVDVDRLIAQFVQLEHRREELSRTLARHNRANTEHLERQFADLSAVLLGAPTPAGRPPHPAAVTGGTS